MALPRYKKYLCTDVKTGAIILAMIGLLGGGFSVISDSVGLGYYAPMIEDRIEEVKFESILKFKEDTMKTQDEIEKYEEMWERLDILKSLVPWAFVVQIVTSACNILLNGSMLYGITQKKPAFMLPWLIIGMTAIVLSIAFLALGFFVLSIGTPGGFVNGAILLFLSSPFVGLMIYFWLIVRSAYLDLKEARTPALPVYVDHDKIEDEKIEKAGGKYLKI